MLRCILEAAALSVAQPKPTPSPVPVRVVGGTPEWLDWVVAIVTVAAVVLAEVAIWRTEKLARLTRRHELMDKLTSEIRSALDLAMAINTQVQEDSRLAAWTAYAAGDRIIAEHDEGDPTADQELFSVREATPCSSSKAATRWTLLPGLSCSLLRA